MTDDMGTTALCVIGTGTLRNDWTDDDKGAKLATSDGQKGIEDGTKDGRGTNGLDVEEMGGLMVGVAAGVLILAVLVVIRRK